nr:unnamed protein product [Callosobruchus chinensis]
MYTSSLKEAGEVSFQIVVEFDYYGVLLTSEGEESAKIEKRIFLLLTVGSGYLLFGIDDIEHIDQNGRVVNGNGCIDGGPHVFGSELRYHKFQASDSALQYLRRRCCYCKVIFIE